MRRWSAAFLLVLSVAGCATRTPGRVVGGILTGAGTLGLIMNETAEPPQTINDGLRQSLNGIGSTLLLATGIVVLFVNELHDPDELPREAN